jgi:cytochrome c
MLGAVAGVAIVSAGLSAAAPGNPVAGQTVFQKCAACHSIDAAARGGIGPNLSGVVGRRAGSAAGYSYSPAMKASGLVWNEATLTRFLANPRQVVPGTRMTFFGVSKPQDEADLIAYLKKNGAAKK